MTTTLKRGYTFTHRHVLEPNWVPQQGQTYTNDAPKAAMVVTRVTRDTVWFKYANLACIGWAMQRATFIERYVPDNPDGSRA